MTDILDQIEAHASFIAVDYDDPEVSRTMFKAAAEIRRLREQCEAMADAADNVLKSKASSASMSVLGRRLATYRASEKG